MTNNIQSIINEVESGRFTYASNYDVCIGATKVLVCFVPSLIGVIGLYYGINGLINKDENFQKYTAFTVGGSITIAASLICTIPFWLKKQSSEYSSV